MVITETELKGAFVIELEPFEDVRGFFARAWSDWEFEAAGLNARFVESNISFNEKKGTLRGMHFQLPPYDQTKLVRCTRGSIYDVIVDLRPASPTFRQWVAEELSAENHRMLYVPGEFAHGYQTLEDNTVTIRDRDTMKQERVLINDIKSKLIDVCSINNILRKIN